MAGKDTNTGAKRARETRAALSLDPNTPLACILTTIEETLSLPVIIAAMPEYIAGACWRGDNGDVVLWVNGTQAKVRCRFTLAHELGHIRCGHDHDLPVETLKTLSGQSSDSREVQANAFAAQLLMPADGIRALVETEPTLEDVVTTAARFGTSSIAALYRLNTLKLVGAQRYQRLKREIDEGLVDAVWEHVDPPPFEDGMAAIDPERLPRLSPQLAGKGLDALAGGTSSIASVAAAAGCSPQDLADGALAIGI